MIIIIIIIVVVPLIPDYFPPPATACLRHQQMYVPRSSCLKISSPYRYHARPPSSFLSFLLLLLLLRFRKYPTRASTATMENSLRQQCQRKINILLTWAALFPPFFALLNPMHTLPQAGTRRRSIISSTCKFTINVGVSREQNYLSSSTHGVSTSMRYLKGQATN